MNKPIDIPLHPYRSVASRHADVIRVLTEQPEASDRRVCLIAGVSRELVTKIRAEMVRTSQIASTHALHRVGADGKTYSRLPRAKAVRKPARIATTRREAIADANREIHQAMEAKP